MLGIKHVLGFAQVLLDLAARAPRDRQQPIQVVADDGCLRRHRAHLAQLFEFGQRLVSCFLRQLGAVNLLLELGDVVTIVAVAQFLLDRLHLLVEIILALRLLHLTLDARADLFLNLQDGDLTFHQGEYALETLGDRHDLQDLLLVGNLDRQVRGNRVGELGIIVDLADGAQNFGRDLLVQLDVVFKLRHRRTGQRLDLVLGTEFFRDDVGRSFEIIRVFDIGRNADTRIALDEDFDRAIRQLQQLEDRSERADLVDFIRFGIVIAGILLGGQQNLLFRLHHFFERID